MSEINQIFSSVNPNDLKLLIPSEQKINNVKKRLINLSPTVELGFERECTKMDFLREGEKPVGRGAFGEVWKVIHHTTNKEYCIKILDKREISDQKLVNQLNKEIEIMYKINHPHSIKLVNHFEDDEKIYMIMNYAPKGTVFSTLKKNIKIDEKTACQYFRETLSIIKYLHSFDPKIVHRDIKPENLLLDENNRIKLCDYGWACFYNPEEKMKTYCGTPEYVSPEMIRKIGYNEKVDIWSVGVLLFEMLSGYAPFSSSNKEDLYNNILKVKINWPDDFPMQAKDLISKILKYEPSERLTVDEILKHPWTEQTPKLRKDLEIVELSKKDILLSHMINLENFSKHNEKEVKYEENYINSLVVGSLNNNYTTIYNIQSNIDGDAKKIINTLRMQNIQLDSQYMELKHKYKELYSYKEKCSFLLGENEKSKKEIEFLKKLLDERETLIKENEEKENKIIELQNKLYDIKIKLSSYDNINKKISEMNKTIEEKDHIIQQLKNLIDYPKKEKLIYSDIPQDLETLNHYWSEKLKQLYLIISTQKSVYSSKQEECVLKFQNSIEETKNFLKIIEKNFLSQLNLINEKLSFKSSKTIETIDFLKTELYNLQEYKGKYERLEKETEILRNSQKVQIDTIQVLKKQIETDKKLIKLHEAKQGKQSFLIMNLEAKIDDIKNFLHRYNESELIVKGLYSIIN